ncbi:hypothetical protein VZC37_22925 [Gordonia sp. LSe1-13]|uniref:Uncharacterized protein n=1 Tax=Gordonia sesuvii TaxID=3116777 RepID=A0ABU7MJB2_9ACTN|nr:hypothetical protein [Gordonia sp. LSe1-13]
MGLSWAEIARQLGWQSRSAAQLAVTRYKQQNPIGTAEQVRQRELRLLLHVRTTLAQGFTEARSRRDDAAVIAYAKQLNDNIARVAKLLGLDAPVQVDVDHRLGEQDFAAVAANLLTEIASGPVELPLGRTIDAEVTG